MLLHASCHGDLQLQEQTHKSAVRFDRAQSEYDSAKETLRIAEQGIAEVLSRSEEERRSSRACQLTEAWQETLSNATMRVEKASKERVESEQEHLRLAQLFQQTQEQYRLLEKKLAKSISKSR